MSTLLRIDLSALRSNFAYVRECIGPDREILACVKANAYGHGLIPCARTLVDAGADVLGIARLEEAARLRREDIGTRLLLLGPESLASTGYLLAIDVEILVDSEERLDTIVIAAKRVGKRATVHLAVDTGMGRFGAKPDAARKLAERITRAREVEWAGVMTHFPVADTDLEYTRKQWDRFASTVDEWRRDGIDVPTVHAANSAAILRLPESHADMVRPGLMLYGMQPCADQHDERLRPVLTWVTEVAALHHHAPGETIGYGRTYQVTKEMLVATLPIGYGDGVTWAAHNKGYVLIRGARAPIVGRISMDQTTVDVSDVPGVSLGDEVVVIGTRGDQVITAEQLAEWGGTINYEVTTRLATRVSRVPFG